MAEEMVVVGKAIPLQEGYGRVTGALKFAPDHSLVGALWMKILRSPHAHARIKRIDTGRAEALAGIGAAITHRDAPRNEFQLKSFDFKGRILDSRVRYVGDEVAAVFDVEAATKPNAPDVRGVGTNIVSSPPVGGPVASLQEWGDVDEAFSQADATVEHEVRTQRIYGSFFPPACIAHWEGDKLTIMLSHQCPYDIYQTTADGFGLAENKLRIIAPPIAGSFGMLNCDQRFWNMAAILSRKTGRPVIYKMTIEEFGVYKSRESEVMRLKLGGKSDGTVTALYFKQLHDNGGYGFKPTSYQTQHNALRETSVRYDAVGVATNKFSTGSNRGIGNVAQSMALNQAVG
ncbi:xanthine dehydrogenase family protein molybdopterin-binding subunit, partial [Chloroflexota bacterium]